MRGRYSGTLQTRWITYLWAVLQVQVTVSSLQYSPVATRHFCGTLQTSLSPTWVANDSVLIAVLSQDNKAFLWHIEDQYITYLGRECHAVSPSLQNSAVATRYFSGTMQTMWIGSPTWVASASLLIAVLSCGDEAFLWHTVDQFIHLPVGWVANASLLIAVQYSPVATSHYSGTLQTMWITYLLGCKCQCPRCMTLLSRRSNLWHNADHVDHLPGSQVPVSSLQYSPMLGQSSGTLHATRVGWARTAATKCLK